MSQVLTLRAKGLFTSWSEFAEIPDGALITADDVNISSDNIIEPRRGFERLSAGYSNGGSRTDQIWFYQDKPFTHNGTTLYSASTVSYFNSGAWSNSGSFTAPSGVRIRTAQSNQNLYFTTSTGVQKLAAFNGTPTLSGAFKALDLEAAIDGASGFLSHNHSVAYRLVWGFEDANKNLILGAPSARFEITNTAGGTRDIDVTFTIPSGVTTTWVYQIYRSAQVATPATPNDELQLVYEGNPTSGEITAGTITLTDIVPDSLRGATIYTAPSQEGIAFANERAPLAKDLATFRDVMFYANTTSKHRYRITLLAVSGAGLVLNDTVSFGGITYTAKAAETIASGEFLLTTTGTASENIRDTALSLVRVINRRSTSTVYAYYLSGPNDLPGQILLEERSIGGAAFVITVSRPAAWSPSGIPTSGTTETSSNDNFPNGLSWSKPFQPESVPLPNQVQVGTKSAAILRIVPLKDSLIIFKEDGIFRLTGFYPSFDIELLDSSARLNGSETPAILNNQIYCLTDQGVTVVADSVKIISRPIEGSILSLVTGALALTKQVAVGCAYEVERRYYLWLPTLATDTYPTQAFVYNVFTQAWTRHTKAATAAASTTTELYLGDPTSNFLLKDRRSGNNTDYGDYKQTTTVSSVSGNTLTLSSVSGLAVGDVIYQSATVYSAIDSIDSINSTVTVITNPGFSAGTWTVFGSISTIVKWVPIAAGNPGITKQFHTAQLMFKSEFAETGYMTFESDVVQSEEQVAIQGGEYGPWGLFTWGNTPWGGITIRKPLRQWVPRDKQRCSTLTFGFRHAFGFSFWQMQGASVHFTPGTEKTDR